LKRVLLAIFLTALSVYVFAQDSFLQSSVIKKMTGTVELKQAGAASFVPAVVGAQLSADTIISTGFKSTALVEVGSAVISVMPLTRLTITEIFAEEGTETIKMSLRAGRLRVDVKPPDGTKTALTVQSSAATASVNGASFYFDTMNVRVNEGTVALKGNNGYTVLVNGGSSSGVDSYSIAAAPQNNNEAGLSPPAPAGYDPRTTGNTGGNVPVIPNTGDVDIEVEY